MADILLYGFIGGWNPETGESMDAAHIAARLEQLRDREQVTVGINSLGGLIAEGLAIYNLLDNFPKPVVVEIHGIAASMASAIAMAGNPVRIPENGLLMLHNPEDFVAGTAEEMRRAAELLEKLGGSLASIYAKKTGLQLRKVQQLMDEETWLTAEEAIDLGFADELMGAIDAAAFPAGLRKQFSSPAALLEAVKKERSRAVARYRRSLLPATAAISLEENMKNITLSQTEFDAKLKAEYDRGKAEAASEKDQAVAAARTEAQAAVTADHQAAIATARSEAAAAERARIQAVYDKLAAAPGQQKLVAEMMFDGQTSGAQAAEKLLAADAAARAQRAADIRADAPPPAGDPPATSAQQDAAAARGGNATAQAEQAVAEARKAGLVR